MADAAHELRSPLASIRAQVEVAERLGEGGTLPADLLGDLDRLSRLVEDLLLLARADADTRPPARLQPVADGRCSPRWRRRTRRRGCRCGWRRGRTRDVLAEEGELRRAVDNLVANAVRHADSAVELALDVAGPEVVVRVRDDGPGVAEADRERVFERFTRLDDARARDFGGTGLGLAIVRELVRRAGGEVAAGRRGDALAAGRCGAHRLPSAPWCSASGRGRRPAHPGRNKIN